MDFKFSMNYFLCQLKKASIFDYFCLVLYGVSLGAASVMMATNNHLDPNVKCVVENKHSWNIYLKCKNYEDEVIDRLFKDFCVGK